MSSMLLLSILMVIALQGSVHVEAAAEAAAEEGINGDHSDLLHAAAEEGINGDDSDLLQFKTNVQSHQEVTINTTADRPECIYHDVSNGIYYKSGYDEPIYGFSLVKKYERRSWRGDKDAAALLQKDDACVLVFMGSNHMEDYMSNMDFPPIDKWGVKGAHKGVWKELKGLVNKMDFDQIRSACTGKQFIVSGHSLGGGLAQLFTISVNSGGMPNGEDLKVDLLYTFGAVAPVDKADANANSKSEDGCYAGGQYWYAEKDGEDYVADLFALPEIGGQVTHIPAKSTKVIVFNGSAPETFPCGTSLPDAQSLMEKLGKADWLPYHQGYKTWLNCP